VNISPSLVESVAGFTAGMVSTLVVHPFDVIKTRLQLRPSARSAPGDTWRIMQKIGSEALAEKPVNLSNNRAVITAFYRGLMPNMIGNSVSWALYFMWYGNIKDLVRTLRVASQGEEKGRKLGSMDYFLASGLSGILTGVVTNPIWEWCFVA
jgi:solute carrier family 25 folate transporter 32